MRTRAALFSLRALGWTRIPCGESALSSLRVQPFLPYPWNAGALGGAHTLKWVGEEGQ